jgi:hypothetical protein
MCELVGKKSEVSFITGRITATAKDDVIAHREGLCTNLQGRNRRPVIGVDPHSTEIMTKARFHESA